VEAAAQDSAAALSGATLVDRATLEASPKSDLDKTLRGLPGVTLLRNTRGAQSAFSLRGANGGQGQFMLDGLPLYGTLTGIYNLDGFPPDLLDHAEVERGAAAIRHGSQALGGTVRLFSRDERTSGMRLHLQGGSFGTLSETAVGSLAGGSARATLSARREDIFDGVSQADARNGNREPDGYRANLSLFRYAANPYDQLALDGTLYYGYTHAELDGPGLTPSGRPGFMDDLTAYGRTETWIGQQSAKLGIMPGWDSGLQLGYQRIRPRVRFHGVVAQSDSSLYFLRWRNQHNLTGLVSPHDDWRWDWGIDARRETGQADSPFSRFDAERSQTAGFADLEAGSDP
jgi:outer membrane cobalamin receptor